MTEHLRIRPMGAADIERVQAIARTLPEAPQWPDVAYLAAIDVDGNPARIALVAEIPAREMVAGFAVAQLLPPEAELETIAVAQHLQKAGVGRGIFTELLPRLRAVHVAMLNLEVRASNANAVGFYRALGFRETGRRPGYYTNPKEDALLMCLKVG